MLWGNQKREREGRRREGGRERKRRERVSHRERTLPRQDHRCDSMFLLFSGDPSYLVMPMKVLAFLMDL